MPRPVIPPTSHSSGSLIFTALWHGQETVPQRLLLISVSMSAAQVFCTQNPRSLTFLQPDVAQVFRLAGAQDHVGGDDALLLRRANRAREQQIFQVRNH